MQSPLAPLRVSAYHGLAPVLTGQRQASSLSWGRGAQHSGPGRVPQPPLTTVYPPLGPEMLPPPWVCPQPVSLRASLGQGRACAVPKGLGTRTWEGVPPASRV